MYLTGRDEIDNDPSPVQRPEYPREEAMADRLPIRVDIQHDDPILDSHRRWQPIEVIHTIMDRQIRGRRRCLHPTRETRIRIYYCAAPSRILHILDPNGDTRPNDLFHCKWVDDL
jgi:hypothetical protein